MAEWSDFTSDQGAMMPETFIPDWLRQRIAPAAQQDVASLRNTSRPDRSGEAVRYKTSSPLVNITDEDIARATQLGLAASTSPLAGKATHLVSDFLESPRGGANAGQAGVDVGPGVAGGPGREPGLAEAQRAATRGAGTYAPLEGLPQGPFSVGGEPYVAGPIGSVHDVAQNYMDTAGRPYERQARYEPLDKERSKAIAKAYDEMKSNPNDPRTRLAYDALIKETGDQYRAIKGSGLQIEPITPEMGDPYAQTPRLAAKDVRDNNHLYFFPTDQGFGSGGAAPQAHPMLEPSGETLNGRPLLNNDLFRVVHDYFGHLKEGHGFRGEGEDNAWQTHAKMYSDQARPAMTSETRGQNSWVNYGPHGEANRKASAADTVYADQKVGTMPPWTAQNNYYPGRTMPADFVDAPNPNAPFPQYAEQYPPVGPGKPTLDKGSGKPYMAKQNTPEAEAFAARRSAEQEDMDKNGYQPYFDPSQRFHADPSQYPQLDTATHLPAKQETIEKWTHELDTPETRAALQRMYKAGQDVPDADRWYLMGQLERKYIEEYGPKLGRENFRNNFGGAMAATTGGMDPTANFLMGHYGNVMRNRGEDFPRVTPEENAQVRDFAESQGKPYVNKKGQPIDKTGDIASYKLPYPIGGQYAAGNLDQYKRVFEDVARGKDIGHALDDANPKRLDFMQSFTGHPDSFTWDKQMTSGATGGKYDMPPGNAYGVMERVGREEAAKAGVPGQSFQDVGWAGQKAMQEGAKPLPAPYQGPSGMHHFKYEGPMISHINDSIERTHRLTGMPREEIVRRGVVRGEIPLYGAAGAALAAPSLMDFLQPEPRS